VLKTDLPDGIERLLSPEEVAEILGVPKGTLYKWRLVGEGPPAMRIGKHLRYRPGDLDAWLRSREAIGSG
jgi:excisionase family DNA binding protein